ncbi:hypothetical protein BC943DRAFT_338272 [Umbelopsis sp. AD052]|nr:hypothetical protein BC943DRAFT_338272 [Umbelopsis sp. AD052]
MSYQDLVSEALPELNILLNEIDAKSQNERSYHERNLQADLIRLAELPALERQVREHANRIKVLEDDQLNLSTWSVAWAVAFVTCDKARQAEDNKLKLEESESKLKEAQKQIEAVDEKVNLAREGNDHAYLEIRALEQQRDKVEELLRPIFSLRQDDSVTEWEERIKSMKSKHAELVETNEVLPQVIELLRETQHHLTGGMYQAREFNGNPEEQVKQIFPAEAYESFKKAMELYPPLPRIKKPDVQQSEELGNLYLSKATRYLKEIRTNVEETEAECQQTIFDNAKAACKLEIEIGRERDLFSKERVRILSQSV